ncbi:MAG TPA: TorF family putative porin [Candidatus Binatia bacterium]|nr:TorF family putative porin [Candidatus Binatia bacterium]
MKFKHLLAGAALVVASPAVLAGQLTGNVAAVSDYMFRGIDLSGSNAALQGGVDYTTSFNVYAGLWTSGAAGAGGNEADLYAGYALKLGKFDLTAGAIYYLYSEAKQFGCASAPCTGGSQDINFYEGFLGAGFGPVAVKIFYTPEYGFDANNKEALYATATVRLDLTETISLLPQVGFSAGDGVKNVWGDEYLDYSITAAKKLKDEWSVSLSVVDTNIDVTNTTTGVQFSDDPKFVVGLKKGFKL